MFTKSEQEHLTRVMSEYRGNGEKLENALGALCLGMVYGHKVIRVMHDSSSYSSYQKILDLRFNEWCPPTTVFSERHRGYQLALKAESFWDLLRGTEPAPEGYKASKKQFV